MANLTEFPSKKTLGIIFRGVSVLNRKNTSVTKFRARIQDKGMKFYLGSFNTPELAAEAYNKAAKSIFGTKRKAKALGRWNELA